MTECAGCTDVVRQYPVVATVALVVVAALVYAGISIVSRGSVDTFETGLFAVVFAGVYVGTSSLRSCK